MNDRHQQLDEMLHQLRLPAFATGFSSLALKASREGLSHEAFLYELATLECEQRQQNRTLRLLVQSRLPREKTLDKFKLDRLDASLRLQVERLSSGKFVKEAINVIAIGAPGVGKSHLVCGVGHQLVAQGVSVLWSRTDTLVQKLLAAKRDLRLPQELARLDRIECLILDDIGYVQQSREEMEVLFTLLAERYERKSVIITTNLVFSEWERIFKDPMTTLAALDRVIHHSVVLDMTGVESYRAKQAQQEQAQHQQENKQAQQQLDEKKQRKEKEVKDQDQA
jgi:DNA replication protein DnaC